MKVELTAKVTEINHEDLVDFLSGAMSGSSYWSVWAVDNNKYDNMKRQMIDNKIMEESQICFEDVLAEMLLCGEGLVIEDVEDEEDIPMLYLDDIIRGIEQNYHERPWDCDLENGDANTCDSVLQYALFKDIIFA